MKPSALAIAALLTLLGTAPCQGAPAGDPCADSRIPSPVFKHPDACKFENFPLQRPGAMVTATLVRLIDGYKSGGDGGGYSGPVAITRYFLRTPEDRIVSLSDSLPQLHSARTRFHILATLGIQPLLAGGLDAIQEKDLYTRVLREDARRGICVIYRMRAPYRGEVVDCDGESATGEASYEPGTLTWRQSFDTACRHLGGVACDLKEARAIRITRNADGALRYVVDFRMGAQVGVNAVTGRVEP